MTGTDQHNGFAAAKRTRRDGRRLLSAAFSPGQDFSDLYLYDKILNAGNRSLVASAIASLTIARPRRLGIRITLSLVGVFLWYASIMAALLSTTSAIAVFLTGTLFLILAWFYKARLRLIIATTDGLKSEFIQADPEFLAQAKYLIEQKLVDPSGSGHYHINFREGRIETIRMAGDSTLYHVEPAASDPAASDNEQANEPASNEQRHEPGHAPVLGPVNGAYATEPHVADSPGAQPYVNGADTGSASPHPAHQMNGTATNGTAAPPAAAPEASTPAPPPPVASQAEPVNYSPFETTIAELHNYYAGNNPQGMTDPQMTGKLQELYDLMQAGSPAPDQRQRVIRLAAEFAQFFHSLPNLAQMFTNIVELARTVPERTTPPHHPHSNQSQNAPSRKQA